MITYYQFISVEYTFNKMNPNDGHKYPQPPPAYSDIVPPGQAPYPPNAGYPPPPGPVYPPPPAEPVYGGSRPPPITTAPVHTITVVTPARPLGSKSEYIHCPHCNQQMWTKVETKPNWMTHTCALILCCFILWPIAWLPYCCDACQAALHYCSNCNAYIGEGNQL
ncbi:LITAF-like zinc ribbon domain [Popillia japonica]|uniref:LITAF-like zinc ribbon domain n=1 Tax=Popillia japonica TaxID=7064 RepID=A0AAW1K1I9_POPJA